MSFIELKNNLVRLDTIVSVEKSSKVNTNGIIVHVLNLLLNTNPPTTIQISFDSAEEWNRAYNRLESQLNSRKVFL